jgi:starch synthase (maltosyl-transferring)
VSSDQTIGKFRVIERVGRGAMGMVYKAYDPDLKRTVAVKVIASDVDQMDEDLRRRFEQEAQACAQLDHPNVVTVFDKGQEAGRLFIVMQFLEGESLKEVIERRRPMPGPRARLVRMHPEWYVRDAEGGIASPSAIDPADARHVTVWGDLAELDHAGSRDAEGLRAHWVQRLGRALDMGFMGFRCDAAYKVPASTWALLLETAKQRVPEVLFVAETLGARLEEVAALRDSGIGWHFNSAKYWNFDQPWCLEQQTQNAACMRSISFPESHDTPRLWEETHGNAAVQRQRYAFAAAFSSGVMMPIGYEYGFGRRLHVVETRPEHWEEPQADLCAFIRRVHDVCEQTPAFTSEEVEACTPLTGATVVLERRAEDSDAFLVVNKDWHADQVATLPEAARGRRVLRVCRDDAPADEAAGTSLALAPAEVVYLV